MKSKEEILEKRIIQFPGTDDMSSEKIKENVLKAMEEYALQQPGPRWVRASERPTIEKNYNMRWIKTGDPFISKYSNKYGFEAIVPYQFDEAEYLSESSPVVSSGEGMAEAWVIEYDNDTGPGDEYFVEWFNVTNGEKSFRCNTKEDAEFLLASLSPGVEDNQTKKQ